MKTTKTLEKKDDIKKFYICIFCYKANDLQIVKKSTLVERVCEQTQLLGFMFDYLKS